jgi:hypothetical protein
VDSWWNTQHPGQYVAFSQKVEITQEAHYRYWSATLYNASLKMPNGGPYTGLMYMGLQTNASRPDGTVGNMAIFSVWGGILASGAHCTVFHEFGTGWSCHLDYNFVANRAYIYRIGVHQFVTDGIWWLASVEDTVTKATTNIGLIKTSRSFGGFTSMANFSEVWAGSYASCSAIPKSTVIWWPPQLGGVTVGTNTATYAGSQTNACARGHASVGYGVLEQVMGY